MGRTYSMLGRNGEKYEIVLGRPEGKIPLRIHRHRWQGSVKMDHTEI